MTAVVILAGAPFGIKYHSALAQYKDRTGKPCAVKVARTVWSGGKDVKSYLSLLINNCPLSIINRSYAVPRHLSLSKMILYRNSAFDKFRQR